MILYIKTSQAPYIQKDIELLSKHYNLLIYQFNQKNSFIIFIKNCILLVFFLFKNRKKIDIISSTFIDYYTPILIIFSKIFNKKTAFTLGGYECVSFKELSYGAFVNPFKKLFVRFSLKNADVLMPVHESLIYNENSYFSHNIVKNGFLHHVKSTKAKIMVIYNAFSFDYDQVITKKKNTVLSVAVCNTPSSFFVKGLDTIIETANALPDFDFKIIGVAKSLHNWIKLNYNHPENLKLLDKIDQNELNHYYSVSHTYVQASVSEGMPNALCEAMLFQCNPIGSNITSIPDIIGDTGIILMEKSSECLKKAIIDLQSNEPNTGAHNRIITKYPLHLREKQFVSVYDELYSIIRRSL
jgi:hypothetical protein